MTDHSAQSGIFPDYAFTEMKNRYGTPDPEPVEVERIDHAAMAMTLRNNIRPDEMDDPDTANWLTMAQVHATLALVEQQRLTNIIAMSAAGDPDGDPGTRLDDLRIGLAGEVWEGLGLA